jgi:hypothetical protein
MAETVFEFSVATRDKGLKLIATVTTFLIALALGVSPQNPEPVTPPPVTPQHPTPSMAEQKQKPGANDDLATILQSGSTNTGAYRVVIHNDGSATAETTGRPGLRQKAEPGSQQFPAGTIDAKTLLRLLRAIGDVSRIPTGTCAKSVSFGTRTQIVYAGKTSGDLQCIRQQAAESDQAGLQASKDLGAFVQTTLGQVRISARRAVPNP